MPGKFINLRIGLHTGGLCAGIVGSLVPRYCLFGDTMRVVGAMESTGASNRIQISEDLASILRTEASGLYRMMERGTLTMKNNERIKTHWLLARNGLDVSLPDMTITSDMLGDFSEKH